MLAYMAGLAGMAALALLLLPAATSGAENSAPASGKAAPKRAGKITYSGHVAAILQKNCVPCHRPSEVAPFSLTGYEDAKKRARLIAAVAKSRLMPPWKADSHGEFRNERRLTDEEIAALETWANTGAPPGRKKEIPLPPQFTSGWHFGKPDAIIQMPESYRLEPEGRDVYRCFVIPTGYDEDRYITALDFRPGNRAVVHHIIAYADTTGAARGLDAQDPDPGYHTTGGGPGFLPAGWLGGWAPGNAPSMTPEGTGILLPKGADIVLEVHYNKNGKWETDRSRVGLYFAKKPVDKRIRVLAVINGIFRIPPGDADHVVKASAPVRENITLLAVTPHMHLLGRQMTVTAEWPDKTTKQLVHIPGWDFNWQITYEFKEPIRLPGGSQLRLVARYDNSESNPRNPNRPPKEVRWGEQTTDEMCIAFAGYTVDSEHLTKGIRAKRVSPFELGMFE
jgi:mono/diheme cytochrome c family protein